MNIAIKPVGHFLLASLALSLVIGCATPATPPPTNGEEQPTYQLTIDLLGTESNFLVDSQGKLKSKAALSSADGRVSLYFNEDTMLLNKDEMPLSSISVSIDPTPTPPPPPKEAIIVGPVYDFSPEGATFNPFIMLTFGYTPEELLEGTRESNLYVGCYADGQWSMLRYKNVDTENHRVTTMTDRFTKYAVLAPVAKRDEPASEAPSAPADRVDVVYFYRTARCYSCVYAEEITQFTVETYFEDELASGRVTFETFNVEDEKNAAIVEKYGAYTSSLFINTVRNGSDHIEPVTDIWYALGDDEMFAEVLKTRIEASLQGTE